MSQLAQVFENTDGGVWFLKSIKLDQMHLPLILPKKPSTFKIRFYGVDETGKPNSIDLCSAEFVKSDGKHIETIDVSAKNLIMPKNGMAVAIEWIKTDSNKYSDNVTGKDKNGKKIKSVHTYYAPEIGMTQNETTCTIFHLNYKNVWVQDHPFYGKDFSRYGKMKIALTLSN